MVNEDIEELKIYFYDSFLSTEQFKVEKTKEGNITKKPVEIILSTGVKEAGSVLMNYNNPAFNPHYSDFIAKLRLNNKAGVKAFWGFKTNLTEPTTVMIESHAGFYVEDGKLYVTTADGTNQQKTQVQGLDLIKHYEYKISKNEFWIRPLTSLVTYLGLPVVKKEVDVWRLLQKNTTYPSANQVHYLIFYIKNTTNIEKLLYLNKVIFKEDYPD